MKAFATRERVRTAIELGESHFREFKSALHGDPNNKTKRPTKDVATNIAQTLVAFANADGGELLVGVEDNGNLTGINEYDEEEIQLLEKSPIDRVHKDTPLPSVKKSRIEIDNKLILYFSVPKSTNYVHITSDGRCLQRKDLESVPVTSEAIHFNRNEVLSREYDRQFVDGARVDELDTELVKTVADQFLRGMSAEKYLQYLDLVEYGMSQINIRRAALLLFSKSYSRWHPRLQIRIMKVNGTEVLTGENYNIVSDEIISGNILTQVDKSWEAIRPHLVQTKLDKAAKFEQRTIYPEHACREALLNAIAHRDYSQEGKGVEVYIYSDRLEVKSPGSLLSSVHLKDIIEQKGVHQSRNTYVSRVLRELGYMRELGEGMRRIYNLMKENELAPPCLSANAESFSITLNHKPIYSEKDILFLDQFEHYDLDKDIKTIILLGKDDNIFSAQNIWDAVGIVDTDHYRALVDNLSKKGILKNTIDREKAKRIARQKKIPFKEFARLKIEIPKRDNAIMLHTNVESVRERGAVKETGIVKWFNNRKGFGFITCSNGTELFVHVSDVECENGIKEGCAVSFEIKSGQKGEQASNVTLMR
jgi:ATP-dependent DNA helicase RecG